MPALSPTTLVEEQAEWTRAIQEQLGDTLAQLARATGISRDDTAFRAELRGRIWGLQFSLRARREQN